MCISLSEKEAATKGKFLSAWGATSNQWKWNIQMPPLRLGADVINYYEELMQS